MLNLEFLADENTNPFIKALVDYIAGLWSLLINKLVIQLIKFIGLFFKFDEFEENQTYQMRMSMIFLSINMIVLPMLSIAASSDIFTITKQILTFEKFNRSFVLSDAATFYITLVAVNSSLGVMNILLRISKLIKFCGSCRKIEKSDYRTRTKHLKKKENNIYRYGYFYSLTATIINITSIFG